MSVNCNKALALSTEALRDKKRLAVDAGVELLDAVSDVFKAVELNERGDNRGSVDVYLSSARERLTQASKLMGEVASLLSTGTLSPQTRAWYGQLDFERLYEEGTASGLIPASHELWSRCVEILVQGGPLSACRAFNDRIEATAGLMGAGAAMLPVQSAVMDLATYARFCGYLNEVEPLDQRWVRTTV